MLAHEHTQASLMREAQSEANELRAAASSKADGLRRDGQSLVADAERAYRAAVKESDTLEAQLGSILTLM